MDDSTKATTFLALFGLGTAGALAWLFWPSSASAATKRAAGAGNPIDFSNAALHFENDFPDSTYLGVSFPGLCGGMVFTALDYYNAGRSPTQQTTTPSTDDGDIGEYIHSRQEDSLISLNGARFLELLADPDDANVAGDTVDEFAKLKQSIDAGTPVPLGLIPAPWTLDATNAHQVVGLGYASDSNGNHVTIWDPNGPNGTSVLTQAPGSRHWIESGASSDEWRGFFVESYSQSTPP